MEVRELYGHWVDEGRAMSDEAAAALEREAKPADVQAHAKLLAHAFARRAASPAHRARRLTHLQWFIVHCPRAPILALPEAYEDLRAPHEFEAVRQAWLRQTGAFYENAAVLRHAAAFFQQEDSLYAQALLLSAARMEEEAP